MYNFINMKSIIYLLFFNSIYNACGLKYLFNPERNDIFAPCPGDKYKDINAMMNLTNFNFKYVDNKIECSGSMTVIWENVKSTDILEMTVNTYVWKGGRYQPTTFNFKRPDLCDVLFSKDEMWHDYFAKFINTDEQKCFNIVGHVYHFNSFEFSAIFDIPQDISGLYKLEIFLAAYDDDNKKKADSVICLMAEGTMEVYN